MLPAPAFFDPALVPQLYVERGAVVAAEAERFRRAHGIRPAPEDRDRIAAFGIDVQVGFCMPGASLFVPGAVEDTTRTVAWLYRNLDRVTELFFSLDTHHAFQIFHPAWWVDAEGRPAAPLTAIRAADVRAGRYHATRAPEASLEYLDKLEASGRYVLTVWPYHTLLGGTSHALVPAMMEAALFHALTRGVDTHFETKGAASLTESYSVLAPEVEEIGGERVGAVNRRLLDALLRFDKVYVFGQAKSHCVLSTLRDIRARAPALLERVHVLVDATSPVPAPPLDPLPADLDFPTLAERAFAELARDGMRLVATTDPV